MQWLDVLGIGACASTFLTALTHVAAHRRLRKGRHASRGGAPGVSILKPLKGDDDELDENLASLARQRYAGDLEILLCAADPADPALDAAQRLRRRFPGVAVRVVPGRAGPELNPKVANLVALTSHARHDVLLVSDSNVRVGPDYLRSITAELDDPRVGLVSNLLAGVGERSVGATLENLHLGGFIAPAVCVGDAIGHPCVIGKSMMMRRAALDAVGGWTAVGDVLGEDYLMGRLTEAAGWRVVLSPHVVHTVNVHWSVGRFLARHLRWAQMRRFIAPGTYAAEPLVHPTPWLLLTWAAAAMAGGAAWASAAASLLTAKAISEVVLVQRLRRVSLPRWAVFAVPVKDVAVLGLWGLAWLRRSVKWRGNRMRIGPMSRLRPASPPVWHAPVTSAIGRKRS